MLLARTAFAVFLLVPALVLVAAPQEAALTPGEMIEGRTSADAPAEFGFVADGPGMLTVVVRGTGEADLLIEVTDEVGQLLAGGRADADDWGDTGFERLVVPLRSAGTYRVRVKTWGEPGTFELASSWVRFPAVAAEPDPDGTPMAAGTLAPGARAQDSIDPVSGDGWDWFTITPEVDGVLTVVTEAAEGDLAIELYTGDDFAEPTERADEDMDGVRGNESLTARVAAGQTYYVKIVPVVTPDGALPYTIGVEIV